MTQELLTRLLKRFGRAFIAGAVATMSSLALFTGSSWKELGVWLSALVLAGVVGGITGTIQAVGLYFRN
jgi:hypothetical protein